MHDFPLLGPVFALAAWTGLVLLLIPYRRIRSALRREVAANDFRLGESARVPAEVSIPNRNYMNLLELPVLFYVVCMIFCLTGAHSPMTLTLAWAFVGLRVIHSLIHLTSNHILHRLTAFALSNVVLVFLWINAGLLVFSSN